MVDQLRGADFLVLDPRDAPPRGRSTWLAASIRDAVIAGRLSAGALLPPSRVLAGDLGLSRGTVVAAYQQLVDSGWLSARVGSGTVVSGLVGAPGRPDATETLGPMRHTAGHPWRMADPVARWDLTPGRPDLSFFPRAAWLRAEREALRTMSNPGLGYPDPQGDPMLRSELAGLLCRTRGLSVTAHDIVVTAGVSQATALLFEVLRRGGARRLAVEDPGSRGLHDHVRHWGLEPSPVPVDSDGLVADALGDEDGVLLTPAHQFPTGVVLAPQRRFAILEWASRSGAVIVEDDYDAEHRYDRAPVAALHSLQPDKVAYVGSVSKTLAPGLRLGWLIPPRDLLLDVVAHKDASDRGTPPLQQRALSFLIRDGGLARHLRAVRARQRQRRNALVDGLATRGPNAEIHGIAAGLHLMLTLAPAADDEYLAHHLAENGVLLDPLTAHRIRPGRPGLVIGYASHTPDQLREAGVVISSVLRKHS